MPYDGSITISGGTITLTSLIFVPLGHGRSATDRTAASEYFEPSVASSNLIPTLASLSPVMGLSTPTELGAWRRTVLATLPRKNRVRPLCPCDPINTKSGPPRSGVIHNSSGRVARGYDPRALNPSRGQLINGRSHQSFCVFRFCAKERLNIGYTAINRNRAHHIKDASRCACGPSSRSYRADDCLR
jgi:hypothetical protein